MYMRPQKLYVEGNEQESMRAPLVPTPLHGPGITPSGYNGNNGKLGIENVTSGKFKDD